MGIHVTTIRYGRTCKRGDETSFDFDRLDVEMIPDQGQSPEDAFAALRAFVDGQLADCGVGVINANSAPATSAVEATSKKKGGRPKKNPTTSSSTAASTTQSSGDTFAGLVTELEGLDGETDLAVLETSCNAIADRFRAINTPASASDPARKRVVELLVEYKKLIDESTPEN